MNDRSKFKVPVTGRTQCAEPNQANGPSKLSYVGGGAELWTVTLSLQLPRGSTPNTWNWESLIDEKVTCTRAEIEHVYFECEGCLETENEAFMKLRHGRIVCPTCFDKVK